MEDVTENADCKGVIKPPSGGIKGKGYLLSEISADCRQPIQGCLYRSFQIQLSVFLLNLFKISKYGTTEKGLGQGG